MVLRCQDGKIALLEATGIDGVNIILWDDFLNYKWHLLYSRLAYRQLIYERTDEVLSKLEQYIKDVYGKKYVLSFKKVVKRTSNREPGTEENFFCSELVASAYKKIGILPSNIPACFYWPGHFSDKYPLTLLQGSLRNEVVLDFKLQF